MRHVEQLTVEELRTIFDAVKDLYEGAINHIGKSYNLCPECTQRLFASAVDCIYEKAAGNLEVVPPGEEDAIH